MSRRVLMAAANFPDPEHPYMGVWNKRSADALADAGEGVTVVAPKPYALPIPGVPHSEYRKIPLADMSNSGYQILHPRYLYALPKRVFYGATGISYRRALDRAVKSIGDVDVVHARHVFPDAAAVAGLARLQGKPLVVDVHGPQIFTEFHRYPRVARQVRAGLERADRVLCVSEELARLAMDFGVSPDRIVVNALGGDALPAPQVKERPAPKGYVDGQVHLLYVGQLIKRKGLHVLFEALRNLVRSAVSPRLVVVGDGGERAHLAELAERLGIRPYVYFAGRLDDDILSQWLHVADAFVLPSFAEGRPTVVYEAMWAGLPVVATSVNGVPEQVLHEQTGLLVPPGDSHALAAALLRIISDSYESKRMGREGQRRVHAEGWTWAGHALRLKTVYEEVCT